MPGKSCPGCGKLTFYESPKGKECTKCGFRAELATSRGRGFKCPFCNTFTVQNNICTKCGCKMIPPKKK